MKICNQLFALSLLAVNVCQTHAFSAKVPASSSAASSKALGRGGAPEGMMELFPVEPALTRIEGGGGSIRTYQLPAGVERVQYVLKSEGRPLKARVELWIGPLRCVHYCEIDMMDGQKTPYRATLKFKPIGSTLRIGTTKDSAGEFPLMAGVYVPKPEQSKAIGKITEDTFYANERVKIQGGSIEGGHGAVRVFPYDAAVKSMQMIVWSKDVGKKSFKALVEVLSGPNNKKQILDLQCGGGSQPYHCIIETPGQGEVRIYNKKFIEDGLVQICLVPFEMEDFSDDGAASNWYDN